MLGDETALAATAEEVRRCVGGGVAVVGLDFEACDEAAVHAVVDRAWRCFAGLDAFVNCYTYEGMNARCRSNKLTIGCLDSFTCVLFSCHSKNREQGCLWAVGLVANAFPFTKRKPLVMPFCSYRQQTVEMRKYILGCTELASISLRHILDNMCRSTYTDMLLLF